jgi:hypothetical protein
LPPPKFTASSGSTGRHAATCGRSELRLRPANLQTLRARSG